MTKANLVKEIQERYTGMNQKVACKIIALVDSVVDMHNAVQKLRDG